VPGLNPWPILVSQKVFGLGEVDFKGDLSPINEGDPIIPVRGKLSVSTNEEERKGGER